MTRFDLSNDELLRRRRIRSAKRALNLATGSPSLLFIDDILSGKRKLFDVNAPDAPPGALTFFQNRANQRLIARPVAGGLGRAANQALVDARVPDAKRALFAKRGVPRRAGNETQEEMAQRLQRGGRNREAAVLAAADRFRADADLAVRRARRDLSRVELDERRVEIGRSTSSDRAAQRREAQARIIERRQGLSGLEQINRRRIAQGRKPLRPFVTKEPIQIESLDEVDPTIHGSGQDFVFDGETFRLAINPSGDQTLIPTRVDSTTGQRVIDSSQIEIKEFKDALSETEREVRRRLINESGTLFARDLRAIQNEISAVGKSRSNGTIDEERAREAIEKLRDDEAELMFAFDTTIGFSTAFEAQEDEAERQHEQRMGELQEENLRSLIDARNRGDDVMGTEDVVQEHKWDRQLDQLETQAKEINSRMEELEQFAVRGDQKERNELAKEWVQERDKLLKVHERQEKIWTDRNEARLRRSQARQQLESDAQADLTAQGIVSGVKPEQQSDPQLQPGERAVYIDGSDESFERLASGTAFIGPDGELRRK